MNFPACQELPQAGQAVYIHGHGDDKPVALMRCGQSRSAALGRDGAVIDRMSCNGTGAEDA
jgi:hypothetical protein